MTGAYNDENKMLGGNSFSISNSTDSKEPSEPVASSIFKGVCIHVSGKTEPSIEELRRLVLSHGGAFEQHCSKRQVSHIVSAHIPRVEAARLASASEGLRVVRPEWVVDSVAQGRRLDELSYQADMEDEQDFAVQKQDDVEPCPLLDIEQAHLDLLVGMMSSDQILDEHDSLSEDEKGPASLFSVSDSHQPKEPLSSALKTKTSADPEFLTEYYRNSRLHHLSTWREELKQYAQKLMAERRSRIEEGSSVGGSHVSVVMHVDLDCFFVSVSLMKSPAELQTELADQPIAVSHAHTNSNAATSSSDISSCNYLARAFGVRNGMYLRDAYKHCPQLRLLPYDFEAYNAVSRSFYKVLAGLDGLKGLLAISCDEAYLDVSISGEALTAALSIRQAIKGICGVDASIGIGPNMLVARMATKKAKPAGQHQVLDEDIESFIGPIPVEDLPGVGPSLANRLETMALHTCAELQRQSLSALQVEFGPKLGAMLHAKCRGIDDRSVSSADHDDRKSVGSEISWGVRFVGIAQCKRFIDDMTEEIWNRLVEAFPGQDIPTAVRPRRLQLKLYRRQANAPEPHKHLGRGHCDVLHRTKSFPQSFSSLRGFAEETWKAFDDTFLKGSLSPVEDIRGIGLFLSDFEINSCKKGRPSGFGNVFEDLKRISERPTSSAAKADAWVSESQVDPKVWLELPEEIRAEFEQQWRQKKMPPVPLASPAAKKHRPRNGANKTSNVKTLTELWGLGQPKEDAALIQAVRALPREHFDPDVVLQLPIELQKELVAEYKAAKSSSNNPTSADNRGQTASQLWWQV